MRWRPRGARRGDGARVTGSSEPRSETGPGRKAPRQIYVSGISRSGTTLLCAILDAHPQVSMAYELLPAGITSARDAAARIEQAADTLDVGADPDADLAAARTCGDHLRAEGEEPLAVLVHRAERALLGPRALARLLREVGDREQDDLSAMPQRVALSQAIAAAKSGIEGTASYGFKLNTPRIAEFAKEAGSDAVYVHVVRDPRDVWASHIGASFDRTVEQVADAWVTYRAKFLRFAERRPRRTHLLRYEDLVADPEATTRALCAAIGLPFDDAMLAFQDSKASVVRGGHINSEALSRGFFDSSAGRWAERGVGEADVRVLESTCSEGMRAHAYPRATDVGIRFSPDEQRRLTRRLDQMERFHLDEYAALVDGARAGREVLTWAAATDPATPAVDRLLLVRHDIDHDIDDAVAMARWEAEHDLVATYCVLHTARYYGRHDAGGNVLDRSEAMVERLLEIQELGHEINLHNNAVATALRTGRDPMAILEEELTFLRGRGLVIVGTSTHGDGLCGGLGVQNLELFAETVYPDRGGARTVEHEGHRVRVGDRSMAELGLRYEGYDLPRDLYLTDSGGRLRAVTGTRGRQGRTRAEQSVAHRDITGILVHPEWWAMRPSPDGPRPELAYDALVAAATPADP